MCSIEPLEEQVMQRGAYWNGSATGAGGRGGGSGRVQQCHGACRGRVTSSSVVSDQSTYYIHDTDMLFNKKKGMLLLHDGCFALPSINA
jgi:hypothetical protein